MGEWMEKYNNAERQLDHYRLQATKISRIVPQKIRELEDQVEKAEQKLVVEMDTNLILQRQLADHMTSRENLQHQITELKEQLKEKDIRIVELEDEIHNLSVLRQRDEDSVKDKVRMIREHIHKSIKGLEIENIRLKRQLLEVENGRINELVTEIERLKEINRVQACNRVAIFDEGYRKCRKDHNLLSPPSSMSLTNPLQAALSPIYQHASSVGSDPLYTSISPDDNSKSPGHHNVTSPAWGVTSLAIRAGNFNQVMRPLAPATPPLPPRRTSASKCSVEDRQKKYPSMGPGSPFNVGPGSNMGPGSPFNVGPGSNVGPGANMGPGSNMACPPKSPPVYHSPSSPSSPPPLSLREEGDGSVSNDYDEIPCENDGYSARIQHSPHNTEQVPLRRTTSITARHGVRCGLVHGEGAGLQSLPHNPQPLPHNPQLPPQNTPTNSTRSPLNGHWPVSRGPVSPGCKREPSRSNPMLHTPTKHGKRSWETLIDSLALVGFTDTLPVQTCVKSSIGKLPGYSVLDNVPVMAGHPYEQPPNTSLDQQFSPLSQPEAETPFEKLLEKMKYMGEVQLRAIVSTSPILSYSATPLTAPLTNLTTPYHYNIALRINRLLTEFAQNPRDLYYMSRTLLTLTSCELVNELYTQLLKQTHRQTTDMLCYWHVIATVLPFIIPTGRVLSYLKTHLERYSEQKTQSGRYAGYCYKVLHRVQANGRRQHHPCRLEVEATCGKPYIHSKPMSIPIHLPGGDYHVTGFDTISSVAEVIADLEAQLGLRSCRYSGYTLFMEDPINPSVVVPVNHSSKLCDVIAKWESNTKPLNTNTQILQVIGLSYRKFLNLAKGQLNDMTQAEYKLSAMQYHDDAMLGIHGMELELATCLGAVMTQAREGNCPAINSRTSKTNSDSYKITSDYLDRFVPANIRERCRDMNSRRQLVKEFTEIWQKFKDVPPAELYQKYYETVERWKYSRSTLFRGLYSHPKDGLKVPVCINITETRLTIINADNLVIMDAVDLDKVTKFGGYPFSITLKINNKTISIMLLDKHKCYLLTELLASYCRVNRAVSRDISN